MSAEATPRRGRGALALRAAGIAVVVLFLGLLVYGLLARAPNTTIDDALLRGEATPAPGFVLDRLTDGEPGPLAGVWGRAAADGQVDLRELRGTPVVVNFWASWCVPCREEAPLLERSWRDARRKGVLFLGLNMQDVSDDALDFVERFGLTFPSVRDPSSASSRRWGATGIPETFFVSRGGEVVSHVIGAVSEEQLADGISAAIAGRPRDPQTGGEQRPTR